MFRKWKRENDFEGEKRREKSLEEEEKDGE